VDVGVCMCAGHAGAMSMNALRGLRRHEAPAAFLVTLIDMDATALAQVYANMLGDADLFSDPAAALAHAVEKTNTQLHNSLVRTRFLNPEHCVQLRFTICRAH